MSAPPAGRGVASRTCPSAVSLLRRLLLLGACARPLASALRSGAGGQLDSRSTDTLSRLRQYSFRDFVRHFGRSYKQGTEEWRRREETFKRRMQQAIDFHSGPPKSWSMGVTKFMDYTESEFKAMLGYRGQRRNHQHSTSSLLSMQKRREGAVPTSVNVLQPGARVALIVRDQGACGSCWAEAAASVLEANIESNKTLLGMLKSKAKARGKKVSLAAVSTQTIVSCTENPRHCGGSGKCGGATSELAYAMIKDRGVPLAQEWQYKSSGGDAPACNEDVFQKGPLVGITGFTTLPQNRALPLKQALVETRGPVVVTAAASNWAQYDGGIFSDSKFQSDFTVNHAVVLVGYREPDPAEMGYWVIKNSWGQSWGENGYIRIEMKANEEEHCGWDYAPQDGTACDGDPDKVWVCGTSGILYDSVYPTGIYIKD